ncbi:MAG TPA: hypothetical protein VJA17_04215, partial [Candidatus Omnitrophota bacterium]|nr:hypothetical protein [Candidatus Omnitrophota bacterium]
MPPIDRSEKNFFKPVQSISLSYGVVNPVVNPLPFILSFLAVLVIILALSWRFWAGIYKSKWKSLRLSALAAAAFVVCSCSAPRVLIPPIHPAASQVQVLESRNVPWLDLYVYTRKDLTQEKMSQIHEGPEGRGPFAFGAEYFKDFEDGITQMPISLEMLLEYDELIILVERVEPGQVWVTLGEDLIDHTEKIEQDGPAEITIKLDRRFKDAAQKFIEENKRNGVSAPLTLDVSIGRTKDPTGEFLNEERPIRILIKSIQLNRWRGERSPISLKIFSFGTLLGLNTGSIEFTLMLLAALMPYLLGAGAVGMVMAG